jgi:DNA-binding SARP family transcriptional activator
MESRRYLRCLGQPALFTPAGEPIRFRTKKHLALLVYLGVEAGSMHRRDRLAELLWPKVTLPEARHSLATALSILRSRLGPEALETTRDQVLLASGRLALDLDRLAAGDILGTEVTGPLEVAAFLEGFEIPDAGEFALWKDRQQARLLPSIKDALIVLIDRCRRTGDSRQIEHLADQMLALDELSEEAIRAKMEARAFAGDRLTALKIFEAWKEKLGEELGAVPSDLVEGMAVRLRRRGWERTTRTDIPTVPTDQWRGRPFIGRSSQYRVLYEAWERLRTGAPGHAMVLGDSGIGKTTLVERLTTAAGLEGAAISRVQCYDLEREIPYATLGSLIHGLLDRPGVSATPPEALAELARTVPQVRHRFPSLPPSSDSQGETARIRLTESFHQMVQAIAEEHPVILVVDDLHLADDASLAVLHLVMRRARGEPIMVVLIARPGELPQSPQAARLRESTARLGIREIELPPLGDDESRELLSSLVPTDQPQPSASVRRTLLRAAGGFPMVLELLAQDWQANGDQSLALAVDAMTAELGSGGAPPSIYNHALDRIVVMLDSTTHNVLNLAAILGNRLNDLSMYTLADLSPAQAMTGMAELVSRRVFRDGGQGLEFVNELVRTAAYLAVPSTIRKVLHGKIADRFICGETADRESLGLEIAWHCTRAGRPVEATPYLLRGAREALSRGALDSAQRALSTALARLKASDRLEAILLLAEVLQEQGQWADAAAVLADPVIGQDCELATVFSILSEHSLLNCGGDRVAADIRRLGEILTTSIVPSTRVKAVKAATRLVAYLRDQGTARTLIHAIDKIPTDRLTANEVLQLAASRAQLLYHVYDRKGSLNDVAGLAEQLRTRGIVNSTTVHLHTGLGALLVYEGRYSEGRAELLCAYEMASRIGIDTAQTALASQIALCCGRLGEYRDQIAWGKRASTTLTEGFCGYNEIQATYSAAFGSAMTGDLKAALGTMATLEGRVASSHPAWLVQAWQIWRADILYLCGQESRALQSGREAVGYPTPTLHSFSFAGAFARWLALSAETEAMKRLAADQIKAMLNDLERFDALDRAEIVCASSIVGNGVFERGGDRATRSRMLGVLPPPVAIQLRRLGVLRY